MTDPRLRIVATGQTGRGMSTLVESIIGAPVLTVGRFHTVEGKRLQVNSSVTRYRRELAYPASVTSRSLWRCWFGSVFAVICVRLPREGRIDFHAKPPSCQDNELCTSKASRWITFSVPSLLL